MSDETRDPPGVANDAAPIETGSTGSQVQSPSTAIEPVVISSKETLSQLGAVLGRQIDSPNPGVMAVAVAAFRDIEVSRETLSRRLEQQLEHVNDERDQLRERLYEEARKNAVLSTRLESSTRFHRFQQWVFAIGTILAATGTGDAIHAAALRGADVLLVVAGLVVMGIGSPFFRSER